MLKIILNSFVSLFLFGTVAMANQASTESTTDTMQDNPYLTALPLWADTLNRFVDQQGRTDFIALAEDTESLRTFVAAIEEVSPENNPTLFKSSEEVMSYHINSYNALAMLGVIERGIPENFSSFFKRASFFKFRDVVIGTKKTNLYDYENKVIRPLGDARSHFALNCMVLDCPRLPMEIFTPQTLHAQLQTASTEFFSKSKHLVVDHDAKQVKVSSILKFYTEDFAPSGKKQDLIPYINKYVKPAIPEDYKVKYIKYDWTINQQP